MTKRVVSAVLCIVMLLTLAPFAAATDLIPSVSVEIDAPRVGEVIDYFARFDEADEDRYGIADVSYVGVINGVRWTDRSGVALPRGYKFEEGIEYSVLIDLAPKAGYAFQVEAYGDTSFTGFEAYINGHEAGYEFHDDQWVTVYYTFDACQSATTIESVTINGAVPIAGAHPNYQLTIDADEHYTFDTVNDDNTTAFNGVRWINANTLEWLTPSDTFESGQKYRVVVFLKSEEGYKFPVDPLDPEDPEDLYGNVTASAYYNSKEAYFGGGTPDHVTFGCDFNLSGQATSTITSVKLAGGKIVVGNHPDFNIRTVDAVGYGIEQSDDPGLEMIKGVRWQNGNSLEFMKPTDTFQAGVTYRLLVYLEAKSGYSFPVTPYDDEDDYGEVDGQVIATYNGVDSYFAGGTPESVLFCYQGIVKGKIADCTVKGFKSAFNYDGKAKKQTAMKLYYKNRLLFENDDYTLTYSNNVKLGTATVTIKGIGNFTGTQKLTYKINLAKPVVKATSITTNSVKLSWNKVAGAQYYYVYQYNPKTGAYKAIVVSTRATTATIKKLSAGSQYQYVVKAVYKNGATITHSSTSSDKVIVNTICKAPSVSVKVTNKKKVILAWKKCTGAKSYKVYEYNAKTKTYTLLTSTKNLAVSYTYSKRGMHYYLVRAINADGAGSSTATTNIVKALVR